MKSANSTLLNIDPKEEDGALSDLYQTLEQDSVVSRHRNRNFTIDPKKIAVGDGSEAKTAGPRSAHPFPSKNSNKAPFREVAAFSLGGNNREEVSEDYLEASKNKRKTSDPSEEAASNQQDILANTVSRSPSIQNNSRKVGILSNTGALISGESKAPGETTPVSPVLDRVRKRSYHQASSSPNKKNNHSFSPVKVRKEEFTSCWHLNSPDFDIDKYRFLTFGNTFPRRNEMVKFLKEIKQDLDLVKSIQYKEPVSKNVVLVDINKSNPL